MKIYKYIAIVAIMAAVGYTFSSNFEYKQYSDITLENIEALADSESGFPACPATICYKTCVKYGITYIYESETECYCVLCKGIL